MAKEEEEMESCPECDKYVDLNDMKKCQYCDTLVCKNCFSKNEMTCIGCEDRL